MDIVEFVEKTYINGILNRDYNEPHPPGPMTDYFAMHSPITNITTSVKDPIVLITQFYISASSDRHKEILECLDFNLKNDLIDKIYLLCEKDYTDEQMNIVNHKNRQKIIKINIGRRLKYCDVFDIIDIQQIHGYLILANSDIFFDKSLSNLYISGLSVNKKLYSLLRYEYTDPDLSKCKLFGPRGDSQDSWIFHSNQNMLPMIDYYQLSLYLWN